MSVAALLAVATYQRNAEYRSGLTLWQTVLDRWPPHARAHRNLAAELKLANRPNEEIAHLRAAVQDLPEETLLFLLGSRYCETDRLSETAWKLFGQTPTGWARVQAICDYVHQHITFGYEHARMTRTALEAFYDKTGVCRDYTHLAVAFCRCMNIPARYCTGYLGDIGVPPPHGTPDFAAWFEVFLDGRWHTFDARNNTPRIGRVLIARGRDASDVAISVTFGPNTLASFKVWTDEVGAA